MIKAFLKRTERTLIRLSRSIVVGFVLLGLFDFVSIGVTNLFTLINDYSLCSIMVSIITSNIDRLKLDHFNVLLNKS